MTLTPGSPVVYICDMPIIRKLYRHTQGVSVVVPREVREALGVTLGDYVAWRIEESGVVRLVSLEEEFRARGQGGAGVSRFAIAPEKSPAPLRRGG